MVQANAFLVSHGSLLYIYKYKNKTKQDIKDFVVMVLLLCLKIGYAYMLHASLTLLFLSYFFIIILENSLHRSYQQFYYLYCGVHMEGYVAAICSCLWIVSPYCCGVLLTAVHVLVLQEDKGMLVLVLWVEFVPELI